MHDIIEVRFASNEQCYLFMTCFHLILQLCIPVYVNSLLLLETHTKVVLERIHQTISKYYMYIQSTTYGI